MYVRTASIADNQVKILVPVTEFKRFVMERKLWTGCRICQ